MDISWPYSTASSHNLYISLCSSVNRFGFCELNEIDGPLKVRARLLWLLVTWYG